MTRICKTSCLDWKCLRVLFLRCQPLQASALNAVVRIHHRCPSFFDSCCSLGILKDEARLVCGSGAISPCPAPAQPARRPSRRGIRCESSIPSTPRSLRLPALRSRARDSLHRPSRLNRPNKAPCPILATFFCRKGGKPRTLTSSVNVTNGGLTQRPLTPYRKLSTKRIAP